MNTVEKLKKMKIKNIMMQSILIFRTSVRKKRDVERVAGALSAFEGITRWNVDLEDWEKVLRIECGAIAPEEISTALRAVGILVAEL